jgi:hypothetical protein
VLNPVVITALAGDQSRPFTELETSMYCRPKVKFETFQYR